MHPFDGGGGASGAGRARRRWPLALAAGLAAAVLIAAALLWTWLAAERPGSGRDPNAALGQLAGKSPEEVQAELDRIVAEGMFSISIASYVEVSPSDGEAELRIENVPGNRYLMKVAVVRDDTGETVYESGLIEPNSHIQRAPLAVRLDEGAYACTAVFTACDPETEAPVGTAAASVTVAVRP